MGRRRLSLSVDLVEAQLERRELMSRGDSLPVVAVHAARQGQGHNLFHQNGIDGLVLHKSFINRLNDRLKLSQDQSLRVTQAFQAFQASYQQLPVNPPAGSMGPTMDSLIATLKQQVATGLSRRELLREQSTPSQVNAIRVSPLAPRALIPFADAQIDKMSATLSQLPPVEGPDGTLVKADATQAVNSSVNAILNGLAETTMHPKLFLNPSDFYLNPYIQFDVTFVGAPASAAPGYFIRGPRGGILPGATLHPFAPN
jgi:hypothetical protein